MKKAMLVLCLPLLVHGADVSGSWNLRLVRFGEEFASVRVDLKSEGGKVTGTLNELKLEGTTDGDQVKITAWRPDGKEWGKFEGRLQGDEIAGTVKQPEDEFNWKARREKAACGAAEIARLRADRFPSRLFRARLRRCCTSTPATPSRPPRWMRAGAMPKEYGGRWAAIRKPVRSM